MPIYEYVCVKCEEKIEAVQKFNDPPLSECSKCRGELKRIISRTSFQLKGSGWYSSDYKSRSAPSELKESAESKESKKSEESASSPNKTDQAAPNTTKEAAPAKKTES